MNNKNQVNLPPIQHVLKGLFNTTGDYQKNHQRRSSFGYDSTIEAARSLQKMSSVGTSCYHCSPAPPYAGYQNMQFNRSHRRTVSATLEAPFYQPPMHAHSIPQPQQHQAIPFPRRARAHTTSGYPPTMVFAPRPYASSPHGTPITHTNNNSTNHTSLPAPSSHSLVVHRPKEQQSTTNTHRYHCHHCSKKFSRPSSLRIHIYSHTGEKPFVCHHQGCGRSFSVHSNMRRHLRVHYYSQPQQDTKDQHQGRQVLKSMRLPIIPAQQEQDLIALP